MIGVKTAAMADQGVTHHSSGTRGAAHIQATISVSRPVGSRSMRYGAARAPRMPPTPAPVSMSPIWTAGYPCCTRLSTTTKKTALPTRLVNEAQLSRTRKKGWDQMKRSPSASCVRIGWRAPVRAGAERSVRIREIVTRETANVTASTAKGSHRVTPYSSPPSGPPSRPATCSRAWFCDSAVGRSSVATTERMADI